MPTVGVVCSHYYTKYLYRTLHALKGIFSEAAPVYSVCVANSRDCEASLIEHARHVLVPFEIVSHDNKGLEFGAYQVGVDRLLAKTNPDWILIANDTFATHSHFTPTERGKLRSEMLQLREFATIIGQVETLPRSFQLEGRRTHRWVTTNLFVINQSALKALDGRIYRPEIESLVAETSDRANFFSAGLDPILHQHLDGWLFNEHPGSGWYAASPLTEANATRMAHKARSILQEKGLAAQLEAHGAEFADLKQLSVPQKVRRAIERCVLGGAMRF